MTDRTTTYDSTSREPAPRPSGAGTDAGERPARRARLPPKRSRPPPRRRRRAPPPRCATASPASSTIASTGRASGSAASPPRCATGANVNEDDDWSLATWSERRSGVESLAGYLDQKDVNEILHDAREMARRRPEIFVGGRCSSPARARPLPAQLRAHGTTTGNGPGTERRLHGLVQRRWQRRGRAARTRTGRRRTPPASCHDHDHFPAAPVRSRGRVCRPGPGDARAAPGGGLRKAHRRPLP